MTIKKRQINLLNNLVSGLGIITLGLIVTIGNINMYTRVVYLLVCAFIIFGLSNLLNFILNRKIVRNKQVLIGIILNIVFGLTLLFFPKISLSILPLTFSLYLLFNSVVKFINYIVLSEVKLRSRYGELFFSLFFFILSLIFLFYPLNQLNLFITIIGYYCILLGLNRIYEFIIDILTDKFKLKMRRKLRMSLPAFLEALIPKRALKRINKYINETVLEEKNEEESDLQIFIHLSKYGFNQFGHMDILFDGKIYSYGNYDKSSQKLFTCIGDGVLFSLDKKQEYIKFCITNSRKTLVEYGIKLTNTQKEKLRKELNKIMNDTVEWVPPILQDKQNKIKKPKACYRDYSSKLYNATKAKFYKFKKSEYKTYFVMGVNCTYFADRLLRNCAFEVLKLVGIISPGTYYEYLEENYKKKNSKIVSRIIYSKESIGVEDVKNKK